ncbi:xylulokinase [Zongyangia hominis]|uniref:FGGY-family carbohydrate kinase n=1 Tax=Zongyangia hominis TaxID=2763677 RepID=A0A926EDC7_9FIRM|nr:FGGY-family carbohydrate kinase [Zongyangia hominis]MBC8569846.1 FGGY-family carbohydrate kinase [Zongyangia hominis]
MTEKIIAWDLGTGGNKASLYDAEGNCLADAFVDYPTMYSKGGWHEQRPADWWNAIVESTKKLLSQGKTDPKDIVCCGISGHSLGSVPMDAHGNLLRESTPIWSDTRAVKQARRFFTAYDERKWYELTGNGVDPAMYPAFKILWYKENEPEMFAKIDKIIGTKDYINYRLTGKILTDYSYASGSGCYDIRGWKFSDELLDAMGLKREMFPELTASTQVIGTILPDVAKELGLGDHVQVVSGGVDNSCMAMGAKAFKDGRVYNALGSSDWIAVTSKEPLIDYSARTYVFAHVAPDLFTSALCIKSGGTSFKWVRDQLAINVMEEAKREDKNVYALMDALAAQSPVGANKLIFNPSLGGGVPIDKSNHIRGAFIGLDLSHTQSDLIRASMEGISMVMRTYLDRLRELTPISDEMLLVGGGSKSAVWRQIYADIYNVRILKSTIDQQAAALGAAACAAYGVGMWKDFDRIDKVHVLESTTQPIPEHVQTYEALLPVFAKTMDVMSDLGDMLADI